MLPTTVIAVELLPGTHAVADTSSEDEPVLRIDNGTTEVQFRVPGLRITINDLRICDRVLQAVTAYRNALISFLD